MKAYSTDLREKIISAWQNGEGGKTEIARRFKVNRSTVYKYIKLLKETGSLERRPRKNLHLIKIDLEGQQYLKKQVLNKPEITLEELKKRFTKKFNIVISTSAISYHLNILKLSRKKKQPMQSNKIP